MTYNAHNSNDGVYVRIPKWSDGAFISNIIGNKRSSAVNIVSSGNQFLHRRFHNARNRRKRNNSKNLGEDKPDKASKINLQLFILYGNSSRYSNGYYRRNFIDPIVRILGQPSNISILYRLSFYTLSLPLRLPCYKCFFSCFSPAAGKPRLGLTVISIGGIANIILDYLFMAVLDMGIKGLRWHFNRLCYTCSNIGLLF